MVWMRGVCAAAVCALVFVANPAYFMGCGEGSQPAEEDFTFGEAELQSAAVGAWSGEITTDGQAVSFTMTLEQASAANGQALRTVGQGLCGTRSFVKGAAACVAVTTMPLEGQLTIQGQPVKAVSGQLSVYGDSFEQGELRLKLPDDLTMVVFITADGVAQMAGTLSSPGGSSGAAAPSVTLRRVGR
jgi:hypothetical protein